jgi:pyruvate kinase
MATLQGGETPWNEAELASIVERLNEIRVTIVKTESIINLSQFGDRRDSVRNLIHYLALRRFDIHDIQEKLSLLGLSSLGRAESHVLYNLDAVLAILSRLCGLNGRLAPPEGGDISPLRGRLLLDKNSEALFGPRSSDRSVRIMVTMPSEAATNYQLVLDLVVCGMDCMRINCAHDSKEEWLGMIGNLRRAEEESGRRCRVFMDLAGPKLRTGPLRPGPKVVKWRPKRDPLGRVIAPAKVWMTPKEEPEEPPWPVDASLPIEKLWLGRLSTGMYVYFKDTRGAKRSLSIISRVGNSLCAESNFTSYVSTGTTFTFKFGGEIFRGQAGDLPPAELPLTLTRGEKLLLSRRRVNGREAERDSAGNVVNPAVVSTTLSRALSHVQIGEKIWFDDGRIGGVVRSISSVNVEVEITHVPEGGGRLGADKGINLPDTELGLSSLTKKDLDDLSFIVDHADIVGYSFVHTVEDIDCLHSLLKKKGRPDMGIILKIETLRAFEHLPSILLASMRGPVSGVMIARGDLAVEVGYERLAEVQEEILWLCEAAHMPAIWATQVLEGLAKNGIPSRAEVTDAAMAERAECVMLNKGPFIVPAVKALDNILRRMQSHQAKKSSLLRHLDIADAFFKETFKDKV